MRLTKSDKEAFVLAVMNDVPKIDYEEKIRQLILDTSAKNLPVTLRAAYAAGGESRSFIKHRGCYYIYEDRKNQNGYLFPANYYDTPNWETEEFYKQLDPMVKNMVEQNTQLNALRVKLQGVINSCSTLKKAKTLLPEFEKYLPENREPDATGGVPAISNLVADLVTLGWKPKENAAQA